MASSRVRRSGVAIMLSLCMVVGSGAMVLADDPVPSPSSVPVESVAPTPVAPTPGATPSAPTPVATPAPTESATPTATPNPLATSGSTDSGNTVKVSAACRTSKVPWPFCEKVPVVKSKPAVMPATAPLTRPQPSGPTQLRYIQGSVTLDGMATLKPIRVIASSPNSWQEGYYDWVSPYTLNYGAYALQVPAGKYSLWIEDESGTYLSGFYSASGFTADAAAASVVDVVGKASVTGINIEVQTGHHIKGKISKSGGTGLADIAVSIDMANYHALTWTNDDGTYQVAVPAGILAMEVLDTSGAYENGYYKAGVAGNFTVDPWTASAITVNGADVTCNVTMGTGYLISGTVTGPGGTPLAYVPVWVSTDDGNYFGWAMTNASGRYSVDVPAGSYRVYFSGDPYLSGFYSSTGFAYYQDDASFVTVGPNRTINLELPTIPHIQGSISVPENYDEHLEIDAFDGAWDNYTDTHASSGSNGFFDIPVYPGEFTLYITDLTGNYVDGCYDSQTAGFTSNCITAQPVTVQLQSVGDLNMTMKLGSSIEGLLLGSGIVYGWPGLSGAKVEAVAIDGSYTASSVSNSGSYDLAVPPGSYKIWFSGHAQPGIYRDGWYSFGATGNITTDEANATTVVVSAAGANLADVTMPQSFSITGYVSGAGTGTPPLKGIQVSADDNADGLHFSAGTTADGYYEIDVQPGAYILTLSDPTGTYLNGCYASGAGGNFTTDCAGSATAFVALITGFGPDVTLPVGIPVGGTATNTRGLPIVGLNLQVHSPTYSLTVTSTWDGSYKALVPAGNYQIDTDGAGEYLNGSYCAACSGHFSLTSPDTIVVDSAPVLGLNMTVPGWPSAPTAITAVAGDGQVVISWAAPSWDGGSPITGYTVKVYPDAPGCDPGATFSCTVTGLSNGTAYAFVVYATNATGAGSRGYTDWVTPHARSTFHPIAPVRYVDTRINNGYAGKLYAGVPAQIQITGRSVGGTVVPAGATAITANLTITRATLTSSLYVGPDPLWYPSSATVNFKASDTVASGSTLSLSGDGYIYVTYMAPTGTTHTTDLVMDVTGYFAPDTSGDTYHTLATPVRLLDSRVANGVAKAKFKPAVPRTFQVTGRGGVPASAQAVTGNLTMTNATGVGAAYIGPAPVARPGQSTINFVAGQTRANSLTVSLSSAGTLSATFMGSGSAKIDLVFDVTGYYTADASGMSYVALTPAAILDTGAGVGLSGKFAANAPRTFGVAGRNGIPSGVGAAAGITGVVSVTGQTANWALFVGPLPVAKPSTSTLNFVKGDNCSNGITISLAADGTAAVTYLGPAGATTNVTVVVTGYFVSPAP